MRLLDHELNELEKMAATETFEGIKHLFYKQLSCKAVKREVKVVNRILNPKCADIGRLYNN